MVAMKSTEPETSYEDHAGRQSAEAAAAWEEWLETMPPEERAKVAGVPSIGAQARHAYDVGLSADVAESNAAAYSVDMADSVDTMADEIAESFRLPLLQAHGIASLIEEMVERKVSEAQSDQLGRVIGMLMKPHRSLPLVVEALAISQGLDELNGVQSQAEVGRKYKVSRALVNHYVSAWSDLLGATNRKFRRSSETRERNRAVRCAVVARSKHNTK